MGRKIRPIIFYKCDEPVKERRKRYEQFQVSHGAVYARQKRSGQIILHSYRRVCSPYVFECISAFDGSIFNRSGNVRTGDIQIFFKEHCQAEQGKCGGIEGVLFRCGKDKQDKEQK
jgi:hypothetical protein